MNLLLEYLNIWLFYVLLHYMWQRHKGTTAVHYTGFIIFKVPVIKRHINGVVTYEDAIQPFIWT